MASSLARLVAIAVISSSAPAFARFGVQGQVTAGGGWTSNVQNAPTNPLPNMLAAESDWFGQVQPRLTFTLLTQRAITTASYAFDATIFVDHMNANSYSHIANLGVFALPTRQTELMVDGGFAYGRMNTFNLLRNPSEVPVGARPITAYLYYGADARERFFWDINKKWRFTQELFYSGLIPIEVQGLSRTHEVGALLSIARSWRRDALGIEHAVNYMLFGSVLNKPPGLKTFGPPPSSTPAQHQVMQTLMLKWLHDYNRDFSHELAFGAVVIGNVENLDGGRWEPTGLAAFRYTHPYGQAELSYSYLTTPNAFVAQTFANHQAALRFNVPLGELSKVSLAGSGAFQYGTSFSGVIGRTESEVTVWLADVGLSWSPLNELSIGVRYEFQDQKGNPNDVQPLPDIRRHAAVANLTVIYPGQPIVRIPSRQRVRVDRTNETPMPALHKVQEVGRPE